MPAKMDISKWKKQMNALTPQLKAQAGKTILKYGDQARTKLERNIHNETGGYRNTIASGNITTAKSFGYWLRFGNEENPAGPYEWPHIDKKSGKLVKGARVFYPIVRVTNKAVKAALRRGTNSIIRSIFKS